jgi:hypothetical protein
METGSGESERERDFYGVGVVLDQKQKAGFS